MHVHGCPKMAQLMGMSKCLDDGIHGGHKMFDWMSDPPKWLDGQGSNQFMPKVLQMTHSFGYGNDDIAERIMMAGVVPETDTTTTTTKPKEKEANPEAEQVPKQTESKPQQPETSKQPESKPQESTQPPEEKPKEQESGLYPKLDSEPTPAKEPQPETSSTEKKGVEDAAVLKDAEVSA